MATSLKAVKLWGGSAACHVCLPRHLARQKQKGGYMHPLAGFSFGERAVHMTCDSDIESLFYMHSNAQFFHCHTRFGCYGSSLND